MPARRIQLLMPPSTREPSTSGATATSVPSTTVRGLFGASTSRSPSPPLLATSTAPVLFRQLRDLSLPHLLFLMQLLSSLAAHPPYPSPSPPTNPPVAGALVASQPAPPLDASAPRGPSQLLPTPAPASHTSTATLLLAPLAAERPISQACTRASLASSF